MAITTTITAIVTREDDTYHVYFTSVLASPISKIGGDRWFAPMYSPLGDDLGAAKAYADRLVNLDVDQYDREVMQPNYRIGCGSYQGCWNAPIQYRTSKAHEGDIFYE